MAILWCLKLNLCMRQWLAQLQHRPKAYRQRVAFSGAVGVTSVIVLIWLVSLPERFHVVTSSVEEPVAGGTEVRGFLSGVREQVAAVGTTLTALRGSGEAPPTATSAPTMVAEEATSTATRTPSVIVPTLSSSTVRRLNPRPIRIATSSAAGE